MIYANHIHVFCFEIYESIFFVCVLGELREGKGCGQNKIFKLSILRFRSNHPSRDKNFVKHENKFRYRNTAYLLACVLDMYTSIHVIVSHENISDWNIKKKAEMQIKRKWMFTQDGKLLKNHLFSSLMECIHEVKILRKGVKKI